MATAQSPSPYPAPYPATLTVDYPDRKLSRLTSFLRIFMIIPIAIILILLVNKGLGGNMPLAEHMPGWGGVVPDGTLGGGRPMGGWSSALAAGGMVFLPLVLMILFRQKYPKWWFDWNLALARFGNRFTAYFFLLRDEYPSTDEEQSVHLELVYPEVKTQLMRGMPLVKWFLSIPHYIVLFFLGIGAGVCVVIAWFAILFTANYPKSLFDFVVGVMRWGLRVQAYAFLLVTDKYPPFSLS